MLYAFLWVILRSSNFICWRLGTLFHLHRPMKMEHSVPKRRHRKFRRWGITQKKAYNIQNAAKIWNQEIYMDIWHCVPVSRLPTCTFSCIRNCVSCISFILSLSGLDGAIGVQCCGISKPLQLSSVGLRHKCDHDVNAAQPKVGVEALTLVRLGGTLRFFSW